MREIKGENESLEPIIEMDGIRLLRYHMQMQLSISQRKRNSSKTSY